MRVLWRCALISVVAASVVVFTAIANATPRETAPPERGHVISHVDMSTHGHNPSGVPGRSAHRAPRGQTSNGISYHGGPVFTSAVNVYLIWYGNWSGDTATTILPKLVTGLSGSPYYNINTTYYDGANRHVPNAVTLAGQTTDAYSQGHTNLSDANINAVVTNAISSGAAPQGPERPVLRAHLDRRHQERIPDLLLRLAHPRHDRRRRHQVRVRRQPRHQRRVLGPDLRLAQRQCRCRRHGQRRRARARRNRDRPRPQRLVGPARLRKRRQVRLDLRHHLHGRERVAREHDARRR